MLNKNLFLKFISKFFLISVILIIIFGFIASNIQEIVFLTAKITSIVFNLLGMKATVDFNLIFLSSFKIEIIPLCTGYISSAIMFGFLIVFPSSLRKKVLGAVIFMPLIYLGTIARLVTSGYVGNNYGMGSFVLVHDLFWQFGMMLLVVVFMWLWLHFFIKKEDVLKSFKN